MQKTLVIGANGQIGIELVDELARQRGADNVIAADIGARSATGAHHYVSLDVLDAAPAPVDRRARRCRGIPPRRPALGDG